MSRTAMKGIDIPTAIKMRLSPDSILETLNAKKQEAGNENDKDQYENDYAGLRFGGDFEILRGVLRCRPPDNAKDQPYQTKEADISECTLRDFQSAMVIYSTNKCKAE